MAEAAPSLRPGPAQLTPSRGLLARRRGEGPSPRAQLPASRGHFGDASNIGKHLQRTDPAAVAAAAGPNHSAPPSPLLALPPAPPRLATSAPPATPPAGLPLLSATAPAAFRRPRRAPGAAPGASLPPLPRHEWPRPRPFPGPARRRAALPAAARGPASFPAPARPQPAAARTPPLLTGASSGFAEPAVPWYRCGGEAPSGPRYSCRWRGGRCRTRCQGSARSSTALAGQPRLRALPPSSSGWNSSCCHL